MSNKKILLINGHPEIEKSNANKVILRELSKKENIHINELTDWYENLKLDLNEEHRLLSSHDIIVLQFPFQWYSLPGLFKLWLDKTILYGFAYGEGGDKLKDKDLILSFTTGGPKEAYSSSGYNKHSVEEFLLPLKQTMELCAMKYHAPIYSNGMALHNGRENVITKAKEHAERLFAYIAKLSS